MSDEWQLTASAEPFDFRHQAEAYARYRRGYSAALYDALEELAGPGGGRVAVDVGCGTGLVTASLSARGWRAVGVDFSAPMLARAPAGLPYLRALGEALPVRDAAVHLLTCGTAFHWMPPRPALAAFARALAPGGWAALFWRYAWPEEPSVRAIEAALAHVGRPLPPLVRQVHAEAPFAGEPAFEPRAEIVLRVPLEFGRDDFVGLVGTVETFRRVTGAEHARFLVRLREIAARDLPERFVEQNDEHLFLARRK